VNKKLIDIVIQVLFVVCIIILGLTLFAFSTAVMGEI